MLLFLIWAFLAGLNEVLVADLRSSFHLSFRAASMVQVVYYCVCLACSPLFGSALELFGHNRTMSLGLVVMTAGAALFVVASREGSLYSFLGASAVMAAGSTLLQIAASPYVALLGPQQSATSRFCLALGFSSLGAMLAPVVGASLILTRDPSPLARAHSLQRLYAGLCVALLLLALGMVSARLPAISNEFTAPASGQPTRYRQLLRFPVFLFGLIAMFFYVGAEITIASFLINYLNSPATLGITMHGAARLASLYGGGATVLRFSLSHTLAKHATSRILVISSFGAMTLVLISVVSNGLPAACSMLAVGCFNSVMVPIIFTSAIADMGRLTSKASSMLVAALVGGAAIPLLQGWLADRFGLQRSFLLPALCYAVILTYAVYLARKTMFRQESAATDRSAQLPHIDAA